MVTAPTAQAVDSETFQLMLQSIRRLVVEQLIPAETEVEESDAIPPRLVEAMKEIGLFGIAVPEEYGGLGLNMAQEVDVVLELCRASIIFRSLVGTTNGVAGKSIIFDGTLEQKETYLPPAARGDLIISFCLTEADAGSDAASLRTTARRTDRGWVLNGTKRFTTNAPEAGLFVVMARTGDLASRSRGISCFLVEADTPGITVGPPQKKMGQRGAHTADVIFEDCRVPETALLGGKEGQGFITAMKVLDEARLHMAAVAVGLSRRLIDDAVRYALDRQQFGQRIADFQLIKALLADSEADYLAAHSMTRATAKDRVEGLRVTKAASCCKYFATEAVWRIADRALQIHGGYGYTAEYAVERLMRDARLLRLYEGTSQIQQLVIARELMKEFDR